MLWRGRDGERAQWLRLDCEVEATAPWRQGSWHAGRHSADKVMKCVAPKEQLCCLGMLAYAPRGRNFRRRDRELGAVEPLSAASVVLFSVHAFHNVTESHRLAS
jgi:hypothetical protein